MRRLTSLSRAHVATRRGRALMSAAGIIFGVAMYVAVAGADEGLRVSFEEQFEGRIGASDVQLAPIGDANAVVPASVLDQLRGMSDVDAVAAGLQVASTRADGASMQLIGVDETLPSMVTMEAADGRLPAAGAAEVAVTEGSGLQVGDALDALTPAGPTTLAVVGVLTDEGMGDRVEAEDGVTVAFTSLATARSLDGRGDVVSNVRIALADGVDRSDWATTNKFVVEGATMEVLEIVGSPLGSFGGGLSIVAWLCLFIGAYLIYVTMSGVVVQRTAELGTLRALGATRKQIRKLVRAEAIAMSTMGGLVGIVLGTLLGYALTVGLADFIGVDDPAFAFPLSGAIVGFLIGLVVTLVGAAVPARRAARLSPVVAMRGDVQVRARTGRGWMVGVVLLPIGAAMMARGGSDGVGMLVFLGGAVLVVPPLLRPLTAVVGPLATRLSPGIGRITVLQVLRERARSAGTLAVVMVILGSGLGLIMTVDAMKAGAARLVDDMTTADVSVMNPGLMPPEAVDLVRAVDGVAAVAPQWYGRTVMVRDERVDGEGAVVREDAWLSLVDTASFFDVSGFDLEAGSDDEVRFGLGAGGAVVVGEHLADRLGLSPGDSLVLETSSGEQAFTVAGVHNGRFTFAGEIVASIVDGPAFSAGTPGGLLVRVADDADLTTVGNDIRHTLHADASLGFDGGRTKVATREEIARQINTEVSTQLNMFYAVSGVAALIALLGMANTLGISVVQRRRELGLLRAVGARRRQVSRLVLVEAVTLAGAAFLAALPMGYVIGLSSGGSAKELVGWEVAMQPPVAATLTILVMAVGIAAFAAWSPARRAGRLQIVEALRVD